MCLIVFVLLEFDALYIVELWQFWGLNLSMYDARRGNNYNSILGS